MLLCAVTTSYFGTLALLKVSTRSVGSIRLFEASILTVPMMAGPDWPGLLPSIVLPSMTLQNFPFDLLALEAKSLGTAQ